MLQKSTTEKISLFNSISVAQLAVLQQETTEASCLFEINFPKVETEEVIGEKDYQYRIEIRNRFLVQVDIKDGHIISALELKFSYSFKKIEDLFEDNVMLKESVTKIKMFGLKIERIFRNENSIEHEYSGENNFFACELITQRYEEFEFFICVLNKKTITQEIKSLNLLYKPGRLLKTNKFTKIYEVVEIKTNKKFMVKAIPADLIHFEGNNSFSMIDHPTAFSHPHLLKVSKIFKTQKTIYKVSQLYNYTLETYQRIFNKTIPNLQFIFSKIISVLKHLHDQYLYHCNLKGEHILLSVNGNEVVDIQVIGMAVETWRNSDMGEHEDRVQMDVKGIIGLLESMIDDKKEVQEICKNEKTITKQENELEINKSMKKLLYFIMDNLSQITEVEIILKHEFFNHKFENPENEMESEK